ncbi:MAG: type II secretion system F family protein [Chloroflexi bacterium]|nr:type II secretion system F family protein [Chloroflexota bacterium]
MHLLLSLCLGAGLYLIARSLTGSARSGLKPPGPSGQPGEPRDGRAGPGRLPGWLRGAVPGGAGLREFSVMSSASAAASALLAQLLFGWPVVTLAVAGAGALAPFWYFRQRAQRRRGEVAEAVGEAVETLRDAVRIGLGIEESLRALARTGPEPLRPALREMERDIRLAGFEEAVSRARERLAEPLFDTLAVSLLTSYRLGGRNLAQVLDGISASVRGSVQVRREVSSQQAQNVLSARVIAALPVVLVLVIRATNPNYLQAFSQPVGQLILGLCLLSVAAGYTVMLRQAALPGQGRMLR